MDDTLGPCLPLELIHHIVEIGDLPKQDLIVLSTISRLFRDGAQRALFRDPGHLSVGLEVWDGRDSEPFFDVIISSPHRLALMVRTYSQDTRWHDYSSQDPENGLLRDQHQEAIFEKMTRAFQLMDNMKRFKSSDRAYNGHFRDRMLNSLSQAFPKLEKFSWYYNGGGQEIIDFLATKNGIRWIDLTSKFDLGDYGQQERERLLLAARTICPKLEAISASVDITRMLLPGTTNVRYLRWTRWSGRQPRYEANLEPMLRSLSNLHYLEYENEYHPPTVPFQIIAPRLREIVFLRIPGKTVIEGDCAIFDYLYHLRAIDFWQIIWPGTQIIPHDNLRRIFLGCNQLLYIDYDRRIARDPNVRSRFSAPQFVYRRFTRSPDTGNLCEHILTKGDHDRWAGWHDRSTLIAQLTAGNMPPVLS